MAKRENRIRLMVNRLRKLTPEVMRQETLRSLRKHEDFVTTSNTDQLFAGELATGEKMPEYSKSSVEKYGKRPGPYQLFDTGRFFRGFFFNAIKFPAFVFSTDAKTGRIADLLISKGKNPDEVYGLNKRNFKDLAHEGVLPDLQAILRKVIRLR